MPHPDALLQLAVDAARAAREHGNHPFARCSRARTGEVLLTATLHARTEPWAMCGGAVFRAGTGAEGFWV